MGLSKWRSRGTLNWRLVGQEEGEQQQKEGLVPAAETNLVDVAGHRSALGEKKESGCAFPRRRDGKRPALLARLSAGANNEAGGAAGGGAAA